MQNFTCLNLLELLFYKLFCNFKFIIIIALLLLLVLLKITYKYFLHLKSLFF